MAFKKELLFLSNVMFFLYFFSCWWVYNKKTKELSVLLHKANMDGLYEAMVNCGMWSPERFAALSIHTLPPHILRDNIVRSNIQTLKSTQKDNMRIPMWLRDKKLSHFERLSDQGHDLKDISKWYPGEINNLLNDLDLDTSGRYLLRSDIDKFQRAMLEYRQASTYYVIKMKDYDRELQRQANHFYPVNLAEELSQYHWSDLFLFIVSMMLVCSVQCVLLHYVTRTLGCGTSNILPSLAVVWISRLIGQFHLYVHLFNAVWLDPISTLVQCILLEAWLLLTSFAQDSWLSLILLSVAPTILFTLCLRAIKFQPMVTVDKTTQRSRLLITGIGCVDPMLERFIQSGKVNPLSKFLIGLEVDQQFEWTNAASIQCSDVDISWPIITRMVQPSVKGNTLKELYITNNRALKDTDIKKLADLIAHNSSLNYIGVVYNKPKAFFTNVLRFFLWGYCPIGVTEIGIAHILDAIRGHENSNVRVLNFSGVSISDAGILHDLRELRAQNKVKVIVTETSREVRRFMTSQTLLKLIDWFAICIVLVWLCYSCSRIFRF